MKARIIGFGEPMAGDDAAGFRVIEILRKIPPADVDLVALRDPSAVANYLTDVERVVLVDAVLDPARRGEVLFPELAELEARTRRTSSHGLGLPGSIALARRMHGAERLASIRVVGIAIDAPERFTVGLSSAAERGAKLAARAALALALDDSSVPTLARP
jgi:hydrogenase maturation protease